MAELDASIAMTLSQCEQSKKPISLFVLDGNLLIESQEGLKFLPLTISPRISDSLFDMGVLNFEISESSGSSLAADIELFLFVLCHEDVEKRVFGSEICSRDCHIRPIVFPSQNVPNKVMKISTNWQEDRVRKFRNNESIIVISLHQPGYLRHLGFFAKLAQSDIFGMEDSLQYCNREWQNRQRFKGSDGKYRWLTVPIAHTGSYEPIFAKLIAQDSRWRRHHWNVLLQRFGKYPYFEEMSPFFKELYRRDWFKLRSLAEATTRHIALAMGLKHINLIRTSALGTMPGKKGYAIVDFIRAILPQEFQLQCSSKRIIYLAGIDSSYLAQSDKNEKTYAEVILSAGINIQYQKAIGNPAFEERGFTHGTPAIEVLFQEGLIGTRALMQPVMGKTSSERLVRLRGRRGGDSIGQWGLGEQS